MGDTSDLIHLTHDGQDFMFREDQVASVAGPQAENSLREIFYAEIGFLTGSSRLFEFIDRKKAVSFYDAVKEALSAGTE